jgi:hypothetical protein
MYPFCDADPVLLTLALFSLVMFLLYSWIASYHPYTHDHHK